MLLMLASTCLLRSAGRALPSLEPVVLVGERGGLVDTCHHSPRCHSLGCSMIASMQSRMLRFATTAATRPIGGNRLPERLGQSQNRQPVAQTVVVRAGTSKYAA